MMLILNGQKCSLVQVGEAIPHNSIVFYHARWLTNLRTPSRDNHLDWMSTQISSDANQPDLARYFIFYSCQKIHRRVAETCIPGTNIPIIEVISTITETDIRTNYSSLHTPAKYASSKDWSVRCLGPYLPEGKQLDVHPFLDDDAYSVADTAENECMLWSCLIRLCESLKNCGAQINRHRKNLAYADVARAVNTVDDYITLLMALDALLHGSGAFWRLCRNGAIERAVVAARRTYEVLSIHTSSSVLLN
jgi:hypothetical protein